MKKPCSLVANKPFYLINSDDLVLFQKKNLPKHSNGLRFTAYDEKNKRLLSQVYYSIGGGFIVTDEAFGQEKKTQIIQPYPFESAHELLNLCEKNKLNAKQGIKSIYEKSDVLNRLNLYAIAVNEENAAGGRIVTAPTNGAAGIIPAVLRYVQTAHHHTSDEDVYTYFLTATAIGILYKKGASISGAEVGCQGEIGVASSMAAGALTAVLGGSIEQIENAAEIAMEHHLGMTCDPVMGLVQIPCIERNAMGSVKAVNASRMALLGDGSHYVSLDKVIKTMLQTGTDMQSIYKETSLGGLAVNFPEC